MNRKLMLHYSNFQAQSNEKIECDNNYDVRRMTKDSCRRDSLSNSQRSSASPTSNIWLRLIEDEENIGNVHSEFSFCSRSYNFPSHRANPEYSNEPILSSSFTKSKPDLASNTLISIIKITLRCPKQYSGLIP